MKPASHTRKEAKLVITGAQFFKFKVNQTDLADQASLSIFLDPTLCDLIMETVPTVCSITSTQLDQLLVLAIYQNKSEVCVETGSVEYLQGVQTLLTARGFHCKILV